MREKIVAGNWKMNMDFPDGLDLAKNIISGLRAKPADHTVIVAPPFIHLSSLHQLLRFSDPKVLLAAQNCHQEDAGAYTGEVSAEMLQTTGVEYVIIGHSERRQYFGEDNTIVQAKVKAALKAGLKVIFCCGEPLEVREKQQQDEYVYAQLKTSIFTLHADELKNIVIAYEPIWAIGTEKTASPEQAQEMHAFIRNSLTHQFGEDHSSNISILYGGSVKPGNAKELFAQPDVDGGLVGGASLKAADFVAIVHSL